MKRIAIFPAAGKLGTSVYNHLSKLISPKQLILILRHPDKIPAKLIKEGAEGRQADYNAPETLTNVFEGADYLFLISYPSIQIEHRFDCHKRALDAALQSSPNLKHIFYTSLAFGGDGNPTSAAHVMQAHLRTEAYLKEIVQGRPGLTYTAIREGIYSESFPMYTAFFNLSDPVDKIKVPHDGSGSGIAWAKIDELGEASAKLVQECLEPHSDDRYRNRIVLLSGGKDYSLSETAQILSKVVGKEVSIKQVSAEEHANNPAVVKPLTSRLPGDRVTAEWTTVFEAVRNGEASVVNGELERLLGRPPEDFEMTVRKMAGK